MIKSVYEKVRASLPPSVKVKLSQAVFVALGKPIFSAENAQSYDKGTVVLSADFELAWAWRFSKRKVNPIEMGRQERAHFPIILQKLNDLQIPITWATVGHLFLDSCTCNQGRAHHELPRPDYFENEYWRFDKGDWYDIDPCGSYKTHPEFYCPDLIENILNSPISHDIGCHSFSHCDFNEKNSTPELIEAELDACKQAMAKFGLSPRSFVFPGNFTGHHTLLKNAGIEIARTRNGKLVEIGFPIQHPSGLTLIHDSAPFDLNEAGWTTQQLLWRLKKYLERAIDKKAIVHYWFHPSIPMHQIEGLFFPLLEEIAAQRDKGHIDVKTMAGLLA